jgi:putative peptidoglycan lipid II flippase
MNPEPPAKSAHGPEGPRQPRLLHSTAIVGSMTFVSRVMGLAREVVFANLFGAGPLMDAFVFANRLPNMLRRFFAEGAFSQAFVPVFAEVREAKTLEDVRLLIARVSGTLATVLFGISVAGVLAAPLLVMIFGTGFVTEGGPAALATSMLRFTFPYIFFISMTAMAGSVLNTYGRFAIPAFTPVLLNIALIAAAIWLSPYFPADARTMALAIGVFVAGVVQLGFQLPFLWRAGLLPRPRLGFDDPAVRRIMLLMVPVLFASSVAQINILFDTWIASFLGDGRITWLYYADRLVEFPLGVFGIAIATVLLPSLSTQHARASTAGFARTLDWALRSVLLIGLPAAAALAILARPMVTTLYFSGAFLLNDVTMTAMSLMAFAPGLLGFILVKVLVPAYYSRQDTKTPVRIAVRALVFGMLLNVIFVFALLQTGWLPAHVGLAAATTLSSLSNAMMLYVGLLRAGVYRPGPAWRALLARSVLATIAMSALLVWWLPPAGDWIAMALRERIMWLAAAVAGGAAAYFAVGLLLGLRPSQFRVR